MKLIAVTELAICRSKANEIRTQATGGFRRPTKFVRRPTELARFQREYPPSKTEIQQRQHPHAHRGQAPPPQRPHRPCSRLTKSHPLPNPELPGQRLPPGCPANPKTRERHRREPAGRPQYSQTEENRRRSHANHVLVTRSAPCRVDACQRDRRGSHRRHFVQNSQREVPLLEGSHCPKVQEAAIRSWS